MGALAGYSTAVVPFLSEVSRGIIGGMSGSPIVAENGSAIGVVCIGSETSAVCQRLLSGRVGYMIFRSYPFATM
jgi:hypothetical protein